MAESAHTIRSKGSALLVRPDLAAQASFNWMNPGWWGDKAVKVGSGGRGGAWFVTDGERQWVLREYWRGGLPARVSRNTYLYTGENNVRSIAEYRFLARLQDFSLAAPKPVAAAYSRVATVAYRATILVERIPGAVNFPDHPLFQTTDLWRQVGATIRRFHDAGVDHVDLNVNNILVAGERIHLIDFDRCRFRGNERGWGWRGRNLVRLRRSADKFFTSMGQSEPVELWGALEAGYAGSSI
ncbi:MAG: 3-deoxy-D-manno-octulosonic acid kinase [Alteromonadaceae bacterium]|nr:3-deoxy-D-manno-octulosonic acid kinase [Alteromonadaceae bacterium]